jgi:hypothetical protein
LTLGIILDHWDRTATTQIPEAPEAFLQWSIDHFGMLRDSALPESSLGLEEKRSQYPHLFVDFPERSHTNFSESEIRTLFEAKIEASRALRDDVEEQFDVLPPACDTRLLIRLRDRVVHRLAQAEDDRSPWDVCRDLARRHLSALGETIYAQRKDLALLRMPVSRTPLARRKHNLMYLDFLQGVLPLLSSFDLRDRLVSDDDENLAYWLGTRETPDRASQIQVSEEALCTSVQRYLNNLEAETSSLKFDTPSGFHLELFEPFDHGCDLADSDDWKSTVQRLNDFPFFRRATPTGWWSDWAEEVGGLVDRKHDQLSAELSACLTEARQEWKGQPKKTVEGEDIDSTVAELKAEYEEKRKNIFRQPSEGFVNDWPERADGLGNSVRKALQLRPTKQQFGWALGSVLVALVLLSTTNISVSSQIWPLGFWGGTSLLLGSLGFLLARRRLFSQIRQETRRATREAETLMDGLHNFMQARQATIENYFQAIAARENLQRAKRKQDDIESKRLRLRYHQQALQEHRDEAGALRDFLQCSGANIEDDSLEELEQLDGPPHCSVVYALKRAEPSVIEAFGAEVETDLLPGLQKISVDVDPAFQV